MAKTISTDFLQIEVRNEKLKDLQLLEYTALGPKIKLSFRYNKDFAERYNLQWEIRLNFDEPILVIEHDFSDFRTAVPFWIKIIEDYESNKIYID